MFARLLTYITSQFDRLQQVRDTPHAIALGFAAGMYVGFYPLVGIKTLLALGLAWALRSSKVAAVIGVTLHDISIPIAPFLMRLEYDIGYWLLSHPHRLPEGIHHAAHLTIREFLNWRVMLTTGGPLLLGAALLGIPVAVICYYVLLGIVSARQAKAAAN